MSGTKFCTASALTAQGSVDFWESNLSLVSRALILQSLPGVSLPDVIEDFCRTLEEYDLETEVFYKAQGRLEPACIVIRKHIAIMDSTLLGSARLPGEAERQVIQVGLSSLWDSEQRGTLSQLHAQACRAVCRSLQKALSIHDEWEAFHIPVLNRKISADLADEISREFFPMHLDARPHIRHRFLGAATAQGPMHCIDSQTADIANRIFLKGRPGTGKSTLLKRIASHAARHGLDHDLYHCSFDSHSLDMLVVPQAELCLMDATEPHVCEPSREDDRVLDLYELLIPEGTDEAHAEDIAHVESRYRAAVAQSQEYLRCASDLTDCFRRGIRVHWTHEDTRLALERLLG